MSLLPSSEQRMEDEPSSEMVEEVQKKSASECHTSSSKLYRNEVCAQNTYPILGLRVTIGRRTTWPVIVVVVGFKATAGSVAPGLTPFTHVCPLFPFALSTLISYGLKAMISKSRLNLAHLFSTHYINVQPKNMLTIMDDNK